MNDPSVSLKQLGATARLFAQQLLTLGENRIELLTVEVQEERERLLQALLSALAVATLGLLAAMTLTAAIVLIFWNTSPVAALLVLTGVYGAAAIFVCRRLMRKLREWQTFSMSLEQLRKDRACLEKILG
jgi:uncharacterized membrane protein YqjE